MLSKYLISQDKNELLGIILDSKLSFEDHISNLCKNASQKINALELLDTCIYEKRKQL